MSADGPKTCKVTWGLAVAIVPGVQTAITAVSFDKAYKLHEVAQAAGVENGVVQDKLWLPGLIKLKTLIDSGCFGEVLSVRGDFGYWVFDGKGPVAPQRPSWNYKKKTAESSAICFVIGSILSRTYLERSRPCTADDSAYAIFALRDGVVAHFNSSWTIRVQRDDLLTIQVDGNKGSAVAGLRDCVAQHESQTPRPTWNPDVDPTIKYSEGWTRVPDYQLFDNAFRVQWETFLEHVVKDGLWKGTLLEGARGVQLTELAEESWRKRV